MTRMLNRRRFLHLAATGAAAGALGACGSGEALLQVGSNTWPGYEFFYAANRTGLLPKQRVQMMRMPSATVVQQALAGGNIEAGGLTLDEVLVARAAGVPLRIIAMLDISLGADVVLARPGLDSADNIRGQRVCSERSAVGAVMLAAFLEAYGLGPQDIEMLYAPIDRHLAEYRNGNAAIVVTFNPVAQALVAEGAVRLFDSAQINGRIMDVLVATESVIKTKPAALKQLVASHFLAMDSFNRDPETLRAPMAEGLGVAPGQVEDAYKGLAMLSVAASYEWLNGRPPAVEKSAATLAEVMLKAGLLSAPPKLDGLVSTAFLPPKARA